MKTEIIGTGNVGSSTANGMALKEVATEMVLVDRKEQFARTQAENLLHATPLRIRSVSPPAITQTLPAQGS